MTTTHRLRRIPSVEKLLARPSFRALVAEAGREAVVSAIRASLEDLRRAAAADEEAAFEEALGRIDESVRSRLREAIAPSLVRVVNATGVVVHTNLGRAPLSRRAIEAIATVASGYSNLELDLGTGKRGSRHQHAKRLFDQLFPDQGALVVNNAAAAVMLSLNTFASGKEVVVSRGELVEIGGSFRVPEILERSGARLREVGTTNKTRLADYERAISGETGAILRVHPSNFRIVGFTETASLEELSRLGRERSLPVIEDFGSGNLLPLAACGLPDEPTVASSLASGVDLVVFSGDKLLGGPQAGVIVGAPRLVEACRRNPMARALRVDKLVYAALEATLAAFVRGRAAAEVPVLRMIASSQAELRARAEAFAKRLASALTLEVELEAGASRVGGGAAPDADLPTWTLSVTKRGRSAEWLLEALRASSPPVIGRIANDRVHLDLRTVHPDEEALVERALLAIDASE